MFLVMSSSHPDCVVPGTNPEVSLLYKFYILEYINVDKAHVILQLRSDGRVMHRFAQFDLKCCYLQKVTNSMNASSRTCVEPLSYNHFKNETNTSTHTYQVFPKQLVLTL